MCEDIEVVSALHEGRNPEKGSTGGAQSEDDQGDGEAADELSEWKGGNLDEYQAFLDAKAKAEEAARAAAGAKAARSQNTSLRLVGAGFHSSLAQRECSLWDKSNNCNDFFVYAYEDAENQMSEWKSSTGEVMEAGKPDELRGPQVLRYSLSVRGYAFDLEDALLEDQQSAARRAAAMASGRDGESVMDGDEDEDGDIGYGAMATARMAVVGGEAVAPGAAPVRKSRRVFSAPGFEVLSQRQWLAPAMKVSL